MKKMIVVMAALLLVLPGVAFAQTGGLVGDCYDCHTMHNSEGGLPVVGIINDDGHVEIGGVEQSGLSNLLRYDCIACHARTPNAGTKLWTMPGGSIVPQVAHGGGADDLAGGNFTFGIGDSSKVHNVVDLFATQWDDNAGDPAFEQEFGAPPGSAPAQHYHGLTRGVFTTDVATPFDAFTCAGARGCHGTRAQALPGSTIDDDSNAATANVWVGERRTGMAAISGAHHNSYDGAKDAVNYEEGPVTAVHDGQMVADGYRFIPGLKGYGNELTRWENVGPNQHNEYYGNNAGTFGLAPEPTNGCGICHIDGFGGGFSTKGNIDSTMRVPGNSMSGFCSTCHGNFHSSGAGGDYTDNGVSGAFLRHPSDYVIPTWGEYSNYTSYDTSAPVARPALATAASNQVVPGTDMVMCLSCHEAHGSEYDYILRFDYTVMTAGNFGSIGAAQNAGGCLACHTEKGVLPDNR